MENIKNLKKEKVEWKKLEEVCKFQNGFAFPSNLFSSTGIPVIKINNVSDGKVKFDNYKCFESETLGINLEEYKILPNDILITMTGTTKIGYNYSENIGYLNQRVGKIIPFPEKIKNRFLFHLLLFFENKIYKLATGAGPRPNLSAEQIKSFKVPLPPLKKQAKIAAALDKFTELTEELTEELTAREAQYNYYRDMLLSEDYLNKISKTNDSSNNNQIRFTTLGEVAQINRGASPRPISNFLTDDESGIAWIKIGDIEANSKYVTKTVQKITFEGAQKSRILKKGDFIISNSMSYGRPYILKIDGAIHDGWASISNFENHLDPDFLYHFLNSSMVKNYWKRKINGSLVSNLNSEIICSLPIIIVDKKLQKKIAQKLDKFQSLLSNTQGLLPKEIKLRQKQYEYYREKLLTF